MNCLNSRTQRVVVNRATSDWQVVTRGVPQGSVLVSVLFNIFINYLECILSTFIDDTKMGSIADSLEGQEAMWRHPDTLEHWRITNSDGKCQIIHL